MTLKKSIESVQIKLDAHGIALLELVRGAMDHNTRINELVAKVGSLLTKVTYLDNKCKDVRSRIQRNNICLLGIAEAMEGPRLMEFISQLLQELLSLEEKLLLDQAHHTLCSQPWDGESLQTFVIPFTFVMTN